MNSILLYQIIQQNCIWNFRQTCTTIRDSERIIAQKRRDVGDMALNYTKEQKKIIEDTGRSLLVSAAAGSGKTAVLVQRIIHKITNQKQPVSVDQLLIVTFTHAAAAEMRERITMAIESAIEDTSDERMMQHLIKQLTLMASANIMTLHSFCLQILRNYYYLLELDPNFRIGNETELALIKEEVLEQILEEAYKEARPNFIRVIEAFANGNDDRKIYEIIFTIYRFSKSHPKPRVWLEQAINKLEVATLDALYSTDFFNVLTDFVQENLIIAKAMLQEVHVLMEMESGPDKYKDTVNDLEYLVENYLKALDNHNMQSLKTVNQNRSIAPLSRKSKGYDKEMAEEAKGMINQIKDILSSVDILCIDESTVLEETKIIAGDIQELVRLTLLFDEQFSEEKYDKGIIDFNDIEHFALALLYDENGISEIGKRYKETFHEVLVDEYQDINEVQEAVIQAVSKQGEVKNLFMVGDVKQSIYKFRLARPEIFSQKYRHFFDANDDEANAIKIDLSKNFRSRYNVVAFSNHIFEGIMSEKVGDVRYDEKVRLNFGAPNYEKTLLSPYFPEILVIEDPKEGDSKATIQAELVANKIKEIVDDKALPVTGENGNLGPAKYKDICILMRSPSKSIEDIKDSFDQKGIPYSSDVSTGYFDAIEVQVILNLLKVLDNPLQDIPLVSVLRAPFIGLNEQDLLEVKKISEELKYYDALRVYQEIHAEDVPEERVELMNKVDRFFDLYNRLKEEAKYLELHELLNRIYLETGYRNIVRFMDNGSQRMQNLDYLLQQSETFETSSYKGVFNFVRYIEHMKKYKVDSPEPSYSNENDNSVSIMSIHKSKGLEFPIVFIIDLQKQFNEMDLRESVLMDQDLGMACDSIDIDARTKKKNIFTDALRIKAKNELISEELRILYVALTRAKEKLYLIGTTADYDKNIQATLEKYQKYSSDVIPPVLIQRARSYLELILMRCTTQNSDLYTLNKVDYTQIIEQEAFYELNQQEQKFELRDTLLQSFEKEEEWEEEINKYEEAMNKAYAYEASTKKYLSMSVSEIKRRHQEIQMQEAEWNHEQLIKSSEEPMPEFMQAKETVKQEGARYGTLIHLVLSKLNFNQHWTKADLKAFVSKLVDEKVMTQKDSERISMNALEQFAQSSLYQRIVALDPKHIYREQPFVIQVNDEGDLRMVQGVIDLYFEEENALVLVDYKTDYIIGQDTSVLIDRYRIQLDYYKEALERTTGKQVKETYIYSFSLNKSILIE